MFLFNSLKSKKLYLNLEILTGKKPFHRNLQETRMGNIAKFLFFREQVYC